MIIINQKTEECNYHLGTAQGKKVRGLFEGQIQNLVADTL